MSNRTLGFLIIFGFIAGSFLFYQYFFVFNLVSLTINSNIDNYTVELRNLKSNKTIICKEKKCVIDSISPFEYTLNITKDSYKTISKKIDLKESKNINLNLEKIILLEKIMKSESESENKKTREEIISEIKQQKANYKIIKIDSIGDFIFKENFQKLDLYFGESKLGTFTKVNKDKISLQQVYGDSSYIFLTLDNKKYLLNIKYRDVRIIDLGIDVVYIKKINTSDFQIVTGVGSYIYSGKDNTITYFTKFSDFLLIKGGYIAIIKKDDYIRKTNFNFQDKHGDLVIFYDETTKKINLLKELDSEIEKIFQEDDDIVLQDIEGGKYRLKL